MNRTRYLLGIKDASGNQWYAARSPSRSSPMRTSDPVFAETWESAQTLQNWLDSIPARFEGSKEGTNPRAWMAEVILTAVAVTMVVGDAVALQGGKKEGV